MKRELQRLASEGQRRKQQAAEAERQSAEVQRQQSIKAMQDRIRPEIKRLKEELKTAASEGKTGHSFNVSCTFENVLYDAVVNYCKKNKLDYKDASRFGRTRFSDDAPLEEYYDQYIEISW